MTVVTRGFPSPSSNPNLSSSPGSVPLLVCDRVSAFHGRIQVLFGLSLSLYRGETVAVLGPNGAGKSSLFGAIGGTVQSSGHIIVAGSDVSSWSVHRRAKAGLAYVPEGRKNLFPTLSVRENIDIGLQLSPAEQRSEVESTILDLFPILGERMAVNAGMLSGGEQQMLAIAVALGRRPQTLLLDEPSQGLAPAVFDVLEAAVGALKVRGIAVLLAEQNLVFASRIADRFVVLSHGHLTAVGEGSELSDQARISEAYFGAEGNY